MRETMIPGRGTPDIEVIESHWPTASEENIKFMGRMWDTRNPELLDKRVVEYLDAQGFPSPEIRRLYEEQKQELVELFGDPETGYKKDLLFHGTGKEKYAREKYSKASANSHESETVEILSNVVRDGLKPHMDLWNPMGDAESLSLTESYFYSKWYASKYMSVGNQPEWQLGDPNSYFPFFIYDSFKREFGEPQNWPKTLQRLLKDGAEMEHTRIKREEQGQERPKRFVNWLASFSREGGNKRGFNEQLDMHSDIEDNWGAVICLDKQSVKADSDMLVLGVHESRSLEAISPQQFKAIIVPARHVEEVRNMLSETGNANVKVIAMEAAEIHLAQFDMKDLVARTAGK